MCGILKREEAADGRLRTIREVSRPTLNFMKTASTNTAGYLDVNYRNNQPLAEL
jgi:hypothetical protein